MASEYRKQRDRVVKAPTKAQRKNDKRTLYQKQRSALITAAYTAIKAGTLDTSEASLTAFCGENWSAPTVSDYDAGTNGGATRKDVLNETQVDRLLASVIAHVQEHYDVAHYSKVQASRAKARWGSKREADLQALMALPEDMTNPQRAAALGLSVPTVERLRRLARSQALMAASAVKPELLTSNDAPTSGTDGMTYVPTGWVSEAALNAMLDAPYQCGCANHDAPERTPEVQATLDSIVWDFMDYVR